LHRWTYDTRGELIGAPHFETDPCLNLNRYKTTRWNGLMFEDNGRNMAAEMAGMGTMQDLDFSGYQLDKVQLHECNYNWKTFIEVYLEDYHVGPFHPGLGSFVTCDDLRWELGNALLGADGGRVRQAGQARHRTSTKWHDVVLQYRKGASRPSTAPSG
jgi:choline monooxygenase